MTAPATGRGTDSGGDSRTGRRPLVVVPARFAERTSALRYRAEVAARALVTAVHAAGGEPVVIHPHAPGGAVDDDEVRERIAFADGVLLPGGGDLSGRWSGGWEHPSLYDVDEEQDAFDLALARVCLADGVPLLAVCRGLQVVTVARGGRLVPDMTERGGRDHRHLVHPVDVVPGTALAQVVPDGAGVSCYHHQCIADPGEGMQVAATARDGTAEAFVLPDAPGWFLSVQWHPEDTAGHDAVQAGLFAAHVRAAADHRRTTG